MQKTSLLLSAIAAGVVTSLVSCNNDSTIGTAIVQDQIGVVVDSSFVIQAKSQPMHRVQSRTTSQLLGRIDIDGYGIMRSDIVTQFMPAPQLFSSEVTVEDIDSLVLYMFVSNGEFVGDSIVPMGLTVYELDKNLPSPIYSDFQPEGYFDRSKPLASAVYNVSKRTAALGADSVYAEGFEVKVKLPQQLGRDIYSAYLQNPSSFLSPTAFADNVFKGVYIENSFGTGRLVRSSQTMMTLYYHHYYADKDTTIVGDGNYFAVTPEIITNNDISLQVSDEINEKVAKGENIVMAPVGLECVVDFPVLDIISSFNSSHTNLRVLNSVSFKLPGEAVENVYNVSIPTYLLLVLEKDKDQFFAKNKLPDNVTSFYATYDAETGMYDFGDLRSYIVNLMGQESISAEDYRFVVMPVSAVFETNQTNSYYGSQQSTLTMMLPYMSAPVMGRLRFDNAEIVLTYSTQSVEK